MYNFNVKYMKDKMRILKLTYNVNVKYMKDKI